MPSRAQRLRQALKKSWSWTQLMMGLVRMTMVRAWVMTQTQTLVWMQLKLQLKLQVSVSWQLLAACLPGHVCLLAVGISLSRAALLLHA